MPRIRNRKEWEANIQTEVARMSAEVQADIEYEYAIWGAYPMNRISSYEDALAELAFFREEWPKLDSYIVRRPKPEPWERVEE